MIRVLAIEAMERYFGDHGKRKEHAVKVLSRAESIMEGEGIHDGFVQSVIVLAAIFHDIGVVEAERKYGKALPKHQEEEGPAVARELMNGIGIRADVLERVCYLVGNHHTKSKIDGIDFQILWEADYLVNVESGWLKVQRNRSEKILERNFLTKTGGRLFMELMESKYF